MVLWADQALTEFDRFDIFHRDARNETKIFNDKIRPLIISKKFYSYLLARKKA